MLVIRLLRVDLLTPAYPRTRTRSQGHSGIRVSASLDAFLAYAARNFSAYRSLGVSVSYVLELMSGPSISAASAASARNER
jgi:hypothetical protein